MINPLVRKLDTRARKESIEIFLAALNFAFPNCSLYGHPLDDIPEHFINHCVVNNSLEFLVDALENGIKMVRPDSWLDLHGDETGQEKRVPLYNA